MLEVEIGCNFCDGVEDDFAVATVSSTLFCWLSGGSVSCAAGVEGPHPIKPPEGTLGTVGASSLDGKGYTLRIAGDTSSASRGQRPSGGTDCRMLQSATSLSES